jgi:hypothetical protein
MFQKEYVFWSGGSPAFPFLVFKCIGEKSGLSRLWIKLTVEAAIKEVMHFPLFFYFCSRASANPFR